MTEKQFRQLRIGDAIYNTYTLETWVVHGNQAGLIVAARIIGISTPEVWEHMSEAQRNNSRDVRNSEYELVIRPGDIVGKRLRRRKIARETFEKGDTSGSPVYL